MKKEGSAECLLLEIHHWWCTGLPVLACGTQYLSPSAKFPFFLFVLGRTLELSHRSEMEHGYFGLKRVSVLSHCIKKCEGMKICLWFFFHKLLEFTHIIHSPWLFPLRDFLGSCCWGLSVNWQLKPAVPRHELNSARGVVLAAPLPASCLKLTRSSAERLACFWNLKDCVKTHAAAFQATSETCGHLTPALTVPRCGYWWILSTSSLSSQVIVSWALLSLDS